MYIDIIGTYLVLFLKYLIFYAVIYLVGKFVFLRILKFTKENNQIQNVLYTRKEYLYPLIGIVIIGNILIIYNFFLPLDYSHYLLVALFLISLSSIKEFKWSVKQYLNVDNLFSYLLIPSILVISTYDTSFNYDAGYYHLLHQNWLRESNLIIGTVNIFWPLGMSSIYEYLSAALWFDKSFVLLHLLNVYFIHFFYLFLKDNIFNKENQTLMNISLVILGFSILDNFGYGGGRNGFIYIQGVTKQDITVGILFWFLSIVIIKKIVDKDTKTYEIAILSLLAFFVYEIKVSGVFVFIIYAALIFLIIKNKFIPFGKLVYLHIPVLFFAIVWFAKSILTTGCLIFPVDMTCINNTFDWYVSGSTWSYEYHTKLSSKAYDFTIPFTQWISETGAFEFRKQVFLNFSFSLIILFIFKLLFFGPNTQKKEITIITSTYIVINVVYLFFFGPIPRYLIGICLVITSMIGFYAGKPRYQLPKTINYFLIFLSVFLLVRSTSYTSLMANAEFRIFDPRTSEEINEVIGFVQISDNWVTLPYGDQCWSNIKCIPQGDGVIFKEKGIFKTAYKP
tara:strand:- start:3102 stop:4793 length:1692 start_codon:yes stop_codon:yes gene_type:complete